MLDIHPVWFLVQMGSFLAFLFLMHIILYKPFLKTITERDNLIQSGLDAAKRAEARRAEILASVDSELKDASLKAQEILSKSRAEGLEEQRNLLEKAQADAAALTENAMAELAAAREAARGRLRADVDVMADHIAKRLVGGKA